MTFNGFQKTVLIELNHIFGNNNKFFSSVKIHLIHSKSI